MVTTRSTSGAGYAFEDLVAADLLSKMLLDLPIDGIEAPGTALLSQANAAGWEIDDLICVGRDSNGADRRLAISCKSSVQVTASGWPDDFVKAAWALWRNRDTFNRETDSIALVTRGRNVAFDRSWSDLKQWSVGADPALALARISSTAKHRRIFDSIRNPGSQDDRLPTDDETLSLLLALELYPLDFQLHSSTSLADAKHRCRIALRSERRSEASALWNALVRAAETARLGNGTISLTELLREISQDFALKQHPSIAGAWAQLEALSADHRSGIETALPNGHVVDRAIEAQRFSEALTSNFGCVVVGDSGVGKSALVSRSLDASFPDAEQIWLGPDVLSDTLSAGRRNSIGLDHDLAFVAKLSTGQNKVLVLDSIERLDTSSLVKLNILLSTLATDSTWRVVLISQLSGFEGQTKSIEAAIGWARIPVSTLPDRAVRLALDSVPALRWISGDGQILPLLANLKTLGWVIAAASSFQEGDSPDLTSTAAIADRLWARWTRGPASSQLRRLLVRFAVREANFERGFRISELESGDLAAFDQRSGELPLDVDARNRIEFRHDLAADWARYQRLKEIADDIPQWSALALQPLWIGALRLFGQFLLAQPDQAKCGWDAAFEAVTAVGNVEAADLLLDALCLDPHLDRHLTERAELMFAQQGALLKRLLHRFLHVATVPSIPHHISLEAGLRIYFDADLRFPIMSRWAPLGRYFQMQPWRVGGLGAPIVARVCRAWLSSLPRMLGDQPMPLRDIMATVALETARCRQIEIAARRFHGSGSDDRLIFTTALLGAAEHSAEIGAFALEMAERRPLAETTLTRIEALRTADRVAAAARAAATPQRRRPPPPASFISTSEDLPPWPLGPADKLDGAFREAVLHGNALTPLMEVDPEIASEILLASIIEGNPTREFGRSPRLDGDLGLEYDQQSHPTIFWKSPFFPFLGLHPESALAALEQLLVFVTERWVSDAPADAQIPSVLVKLSEGKTRQFVGTSWQFNWSQDNSTSNGQICCALDALERWLTLKVDAGEDLHPWCERLLALEGSTAILGVLVNLGKYQPELFKGPLRPLVAIEVLYHWDLHRVQNAGVGFDTFTWYRQGETALSMARDWVLAPHRNTDLRRVIADLTAADTAFANHVVAAAAEWPVPADTKGQLEQRILQSELDPTNRHSEVDRETGETVTTLVYPTELQVDLMAHQIGAGTRLESLTLPRQCERVLAGDADLEEASAQYLAGVLPNLENGLPKDNERLPMIAAAAATLIARGGAWYRQRAETVSQAEATVRAIIAHLDAKSEQEDYNADYALRFAAAGALHAAMDAAPPEQWNSVLTTAMTVHSGSAVSTLMALAQRHHVRLGSAWYRLNYLLLLVAGFSRLTPRYDEQSYTPTWNRWRERLRAQPVFGLSATFEIIQPANIARRVERLLEGRRSRAHPNRPRRLTGKSRRFVGLDTHILEAGYAWLLNHEAVDDTTGEAENHVLLQALWDFEAWRMEGEREGDEFDVTDGEYDLPSQMGYSILRVAPAFVMAARDDDPAPLWTSILAIGPAGHQAVEHFGSCWFLQLFKPVDTNRFMTLWSAMLNYALEAEWTSNRHWYHGRAMRRQLLGLNSSIELSQPTEVRDRLVEIVDYFRRWARDETSMDEDDTASLAHFLTSDAGRDLRMEGIVWLRDALETNDGFRRASTGNNIAEVIDVLLIQHASELLARADSRNAMIEIVARLVRAQVATAMGLQARIAALR